MTIRGSLDIDYVVAALLRNESYTTIAERETARLGEDVSRNVIAGVARDVKAGKLRPSKLAVADEFIFGIEPPVGIPVYTGELELSGNFLVLNDVHLPFTNYGLLEKALDLAQVNNITQVVIAGDWVNLDQFSIFKKLTPEISFTEEVRHSLELTKKVFSQFNDVYFLRGNHEDRWLLQVDHDFQFFVEMITHPDVRDKVTATPYDRIFLTSGGHRWGIFHQRNAGKHKARAAEQLALKHLCNVVATHQHTISYGHDPYNHFVAITSGGLHDHRKMAYVQLKSTTSNTPENSFVTIIDGRGDLWTDDPRMTKWE